MMSIDLDEPQTASAGEQHRDVDDIASRSIADDTIELDLPTLAAALSQRLRAAGLPVTPDRAVTFAQALSLVGPVSTGQLYCTARATFVSARAQQPTFDRVFSSLFGYAYSEGAPTPSHARAPRPGSGNHGTTRRDRTTSCDTLLRTAGRL